MKFTEEEIQAMIDNHFEQMFAAIRRYEEFRGYMANNLYVHIDQDLLDKQTRRYEKEIANHEDRIEELMFLESM